MVKEVCTGNGGRCEIAGDSDLAKAERYLYRIIRAYGL